MAYIFKTSSQPCQVTCHRRRHLSFHSCTPESARTARFAVVGSPAERPCLGAKAPSTNPPSRRQAGSTQPRGRRRVRAWFSRRRTVARGNLSVMGHSGARRRDDSPGAAKHGRGRRTACMQATACTRQAASHAGAREEQGRGGATASHGAR